MVLQGKVCNCPTPKKYYLGSFTKMRRQFGSVYGHRSPIRLTKDVFGQGSMWPAWSRNLGRGLVKAQRWLTCWWLSSEGESDGKELDMIHGFSNSKDSIGFDTCATIL